jgi:general secretion pathway protein G
VRTGFTLIEMLLVVAIIGLLATVIAVKTTGQMDKTRRQTTWLQAANIKTAITQFDLEVGRLPVSLDELVVEGDKDWPGPFLDSEEVPTDAWGNDFRMESKGKRIRVVSPGPDGQFDTGDDLWK